MPVSQSTIQPSKSTSDSHVLGAGSILAALKGPAIPSSTHPLNPQRKLIIVPNNSLMDDHQSQLAKILQEQGLAVVCKPEVGELIKAVKEAKSIGEAKVEEGENGFAGFVNDVTGWE